MTWVGDKVPWKEDRATMPVDETEAKIKKLYAPNGAVLLTISDRPPTGFHQGERNVPRRR